MGTTHSTDKEMSEKEVCNSPKY